MRDCSNVSPVARTGNEIKDKLFHIFVTQRHMRICQFNDGAILSGHTKLLWSKVTVTEHDEMRNSKWHRDLFSEHKETAREPEYIKHVSLNTLGTMYSVFTERCLPNAATFKSDNTKSLQGITCLSVRSEQCCSAARKPQGVYGSYWERVENTRSESQKHTAALWGGLFKLLCISNSQAQSCLFLTFH